MSTSLALARSPDAPPFLGGVDEERTMWSARRRALVAKYDRAVALGIALRHVRSAVTYSQILAALEEVLERHIGAVAYAVVEASDDGSRALLSRGLERARVDELVHEDEPSEPPLVWCRLGAGEHTLGWLAICRLSSRKPALDGFDLELLAALASPIVVALQAARANATRETVRPPRGA